MMQFLVVPTDGSTAHLLNIVYSNTQQLKEQGKIRIFQLIYEEDGAVEIEEVDEKGMGHEVETL